MRPIRTLAPILLSVVMLAAACGSDEATDTTTPNDQGSSTTIAAISGGTTIAGGSTTTTSLADGETTTTVPGATTTTTAGGDSTTTTLAGGSTTTTTVVPDTTSTTTLAGGSTTTTTTGGGTALLTIGDDRGFSFGYPASWELIQDDFGEYFISAPSGDGNGDFAPSIEIYLDDFSGLPASEYHELWIDVLAGQPGFVMISEGPSEIGGLPAYVYEYLRPGFDVDLHYRDAFLDFNESVFNLVYVGSVDDYDAWLADADRIWNSFDFSG